MRAGRPMPVLEGALSVGLFNEALPDVDGLSTTGFAGFIDRALSVASLVVVVAMLLTGPWHLAHLGPIWTAIVGGAGVASAVLMPIYAWSRRGIRPLAILFSATVMIGTLGWGLCWSGPEAADPAPLLVIVLGCGVLSVGVASTARLGVIYSLVIGTAYGLTRLTLAGGNGTPLNSFQDALLVAIPPIAFLIVLQQARIALTAVDTRLAERHAESADAAVSQALIDERSRLDAIVHDEVLTTLVAAAGSRGDEAHVASQAQHAIAALRQEASLEQTNSPITIDQFVRLAKDVTATVCPRAKVIGEIPAVTLTLPQRVVRPILQAIREAALNVEKHSDAQHAQVYVQVTASGRRIALRVSITDDGRGFDPAAITAERLGVRLSLQGRMLAIGGRAEILSTPARGTVVRLLWSVDRVRPVTHRRSPCEIVAHHPIFGEVDPKRLKVVGLMLAALYVFIAALNAAQASPGWIAGTVALLAVGFALGLRASGRGPMSWWKGWLLALCAVGAAAAGLAGMPDQMWLAYGTWFLVPEIFLLVITFADGQAVPAWLAAIAHTVMTGTVALQLGLSPTRTILTILAPLGWLVLTAATFRWLDGIWAEIEEADQAAAEVAELDAAVFSKLVLREVWLTELRSEVGPVLDNLASGAQLNDLDRIHLLLLESSLRDGIKASNFNSPGLSVAIMEARTRGVLVTLVDNRGSRLPEPARRAALHTLEQLVGEAVTGRIVARTAPEGYDDAVTIVRIPSPGETRLTRIASDGTIVAEEHVQARPVTSRT